MVIILFSFLTSYFNGDQYAVAINVPKQQCQSEFYPNTRNFLIDDRSEEVKPHTGKNMSVYTGKQLIAAGVDKIDDKHSEYLLMYPLNNSHLTNLLNTKKDGCVVLYTFLSPCIARCLNNNISPRRDIIRGLDQLGAYQGIKAFVFTHIYYADKTNPNLRHELKKIADRVPLYYCNENGCILCGQPGSNVPVIDECLRDP